MDSSTDAVDSKEIDCYIERYANRLSAIEEDVFEFWKREQSVSRLTYNRILTSQNLLCFISEVSVNVRRGDRNVGDSGDNGIGRTFIQPIEPHHGFAKKQDWFGIG